MKKITIILIGLMLLSACAGNERSVTEEVSSETSSNSFEINDHVYKLVGKDLLDIDYIDNKTLALEFEFTNNGEEAVSPDLTLDFMAEQETEKTIEVLFGSPLPDDYKQEQVDMATKEIKPGATVNIVIAYQLIDENSPVYLRTFFNEVDLMIIEP